MATQIDAALSRVLKSHPISSQGDVVASPEVEVRASALLRRLESMSADIRRSAIRSLSTREAVLLAFAGAAQLDRQSAREILLELGEARQVRLRPVIWAEAIILAGGISKTHPVRALFAYENTLLAKAALAHNPLGVIVDAYKAVDSRLDAFAKETGLALAERVLVATRRHLVVNHVNLTEAREGGARLLEWVQAEVSAAEVDAWFAKYLEVTRITRWLARNEILREITRRHGRPQDGAYFWRAVSAETQSAVTAWVNEATLVRFLGEGDRTSFWRKFLMNMDVIKESEDGAALLILFQHVVAVQFKDSGKATYLMDRRIASRLRKLEEGRLYSKVLELNRNQQTLGRYEHRGNHWQVNAAATVRQVLKSVTG